MKDIDMLDLKNDPKCKEIDNMLIDYAKKHIKSEMMKKLEKEDDIAFGNSVISFDEKNNARKNFYDSLGAYINSFENIDDRKQVAGHFLFKTVNLCKFDKEKKRQSPFLNEGANVFSSIIENYPLFDEDKVRFYKFIKGAKEKKISSYALNVVSPKDYEDPMKNKNLDDVVPSFAFLQEYTKYLCQYAEDAYCEDVSVNTLYSLLKRNTSLSALDIVQPTLFTEASKKQTINKKGVLEVAKAFASNVSEYGVAKGENNEKFERNMINMFSDIVVKCGYKPSEVEELKQSLVRNADCKSHFEEISEKIGDAYLLSKKCFNRSYQR